MTETLAYGYSSESTNRELSNEYQGLDGFQKSLHSCALDGSSLSIGRVNLKNSPVNPSLQGMCSIILIIELECFVYIYAHVASLFVLRCKCRVRHRYLPVCPGK